MAHDQRSQQVSLGCGTLILIAFIVNFFSQPDTSNLRREIRGLKGEVRELKTEIKGLRKDVQAIQPAEAR